MARARTHTPLHVLINGRLVGELAKRSDGAIRFAYDPSWLDWEHRFAISLSLPLRESAYRGAEVIAVFDNLLPDSTQVRQAVAERTGAAGADAFSLLEQLGRDCVGAMQFIPDGEDMDPIGALRGEELSEEEIETRLRNLERAPLGVDPEHEFRISIAGAQEKTALLFHEDKWISPRGTTPTTHILKPQIGSIPTSSGVIDMTASVDNEHYCLSVAEAFGLPVNQTTIQTFGERRVLVIKRFDRFLSRDGRLLRKPQEDFCQALGVPSTQKYQSTVAAHRSGPSNIDIAEVLTGSDDPVGDLMTLFRSQIVFWLIGATDGHAKNFSVFLNPGGRFSLTPLYDILSAQPAFDANQIPRNRYKLAMSVGKSSHYRIQFIRRRHFLETARMMRLGGTPANLVIQDVLERGQSAADQALERMPDDFDTSIHESVSQAIKTRLNRLAM
jgi:serine/threonine-protein kinase HipA